MHVIFDIDGVLADCTHRLHYIADKPKNWKAFFDAAGGDLLITEMANTFKTLRAAGIPVSIITARPESIRQETAAWLRIFGLDHYTHLLMRPYNDYRPSSVVKRDQLFALRALGVEPTLVFEDNEANCKMFHEEGLVVCRVFQR
jgi:phosphoglycolate phosphatase-like HAD superfamily hydrolase